MIGLVQKQLAESRVIHRRISYMIDDANVLISKILEDESNLEHATTLQGNVREILEVQLSMVKYQEVLMGLEEWLSKEK